MYQIEITNPEIIFLSDLIAGKSRSIQLEIEGYEEEIKNRGAADPELDDLLIEMQHDKALSISLLRKLKIVINE